MGQEAQLIGGRNLLGMDCSERPLLWRSSRTEIHRGPLRRSGGTSRAGATKDWRISWSRSGLQQDPREECGLGEKAADLVQGRFERGPLYAGGPLERQVPRRAIGQF